MHDFEMTGGPRELSEREAARLAELRVALDGYRRAGLDAGRALREIRERRLWRSSPWTSWTRWCREELPFTKRTADRLIVFAEVVADMGPRGPAPVDEKQARWLRPLSAAERDEVAADVNRASRGRGFEGITAERVRRIASEVAGGRSGGEVIPLRRGALVQVSTGRGVGPVSLRASGLLPLLDRFEAAAVAIAGLGPDAVETAMLAIPEGDAVARVEQIERAYRTARRLMEAAAARWPEGPSVGQERWALP